MKAHHQCTNPASLSEKVCADGLDASLSSRRELADRLEVVLS